MSNKVTRRVALGTIAGGLAGTAVVLRALKREYQVDLPDGPLASRGREVPVTYYGVETTMEMPVRRMDKREFDAFIRERMKNDPSLVEARKMGVSKWKEQNLKESMANLAEREERQIASVMNSTLSEKEKLSVVDVIKKTTLASRQKQIEALDALCK